MYVKNPLYFYFNPSVKSSEPLNGNCWLNLTKLALVLYIFLVTLYSALCMVLLHTCIPFRNEKTLASSGISL